VFFAPKAKGTGHIITCIRIEDAKGSSEAVKLAGKHVIPFLLQRGYIKSFEKTRPEQKVIINKTALVNKSPQPTGQRNAVTVTDTANAPAQ
jgi:2-methylisocitrate lyase-like PEP mutase family enzyme